MRRFPRVAKALFYFVIIFMVILGFGALYLKPLPTVSLNATQVEQTVQAGVNIRLTGIAASWTPTSTPNIQATIEARVEVAQTPTELPIPTLPTPTEGVQNEASNIFSWIGNLIQGIFAILGAIWSVILGLWNIAGFGGACTQLLCCIGLPVILLIIYINNT